MSFFDDASLAFLPSSGAGKDGKAYSIKPTTGAGDFTFSRGSNLAATRVGPTGLIEKGRENLLRQSNNFGTTWTKTSTTIASDVIAGPLGELADSATPTATNAQHRVLQAPVSTGMGTFSMYIKQGELSRIVIHLLGVNKGRGFDCSDNTTFGAVGVAADAEDYAITDAGNGWSKIEVFAGGVTTRVDIYIANPIAGGNNSVWLGDGVSKIYISSAQFELGLAATDYIESGATTGKAGLLEDEPRFDYSGGATCPSLLLEPSRTNLIEYSEYLNSGWSYARSSSSLSSFVSPDGDVKSYKFVENLDTNKSFYIYQRPTSVSGQTYTQSIFAKAGERDWLKVELNAKYAYFDLTNGLIGSTSASTTANIEQLSNGWYRCSVSAITTSTAPYIAYYLAIADGDSVYDGDGTSGLYLWGGQYEQGSYPTSYIPNHSGGSVTRGGDECTGAGDASTFNASEGVLYAEISTNTDFTDKAISLNNGVVGATNNRLWMGYSTTAKRVYTLGYVNNSVQFVFSKLMTDESLFVKIACKYAENDVAFFVNGEKVATDTSAIAFTELTSMDFNIGNGANASPLYGNAKQVLVFNEALSDADCITLTTL